MTRVSIAFVLAAAVVDAQDAQQAIALLEQELSPAEVVKRITDEGPGRDTRRGPCRSFSV